LHQTGSLSQRDGSGGPDLDRILMIALIAIPMGCYFAWYINGKRRASQARSLVPATSDSEFLHHKAFLKANVPEDYILSFKRFFEYEYSLGKCLARPEMTIRNLSDISPDSPLVDALGVCYLDRDLERSDKSAPSVLRSGTIADIICLCWKLNIKKPK
jgi:hypothetical protein